MSDYMSNKLDLHLTSLKELEDTIYTFKVAFDRAMDEREMLRDEIARLQGEVQRLRFVNAEADYALNEILNGYERLLAQSVLDVNPGANRYSMIAREAIKKINENKLKLNLEYR